MRAAHSFLEGASIARGAGMSAWDAPTRWDGHHTLPLAVRPVGAALSA